ncbi:MAG: hypothetical protein COX79_01070 [Candidatus Levybacteria bacterium CG_4_10_14_0_2_um_filter_36_16]|nr:MAG: hypothetical protein AUK12_03855 [Candidatus Levybacteria bacterium CG2_30_37_29]PIR78938.1 MAG: hypothetical protein COU26_03920 [Candidatus Levybacteria bacterium CG10_big_fil_rev_8_21_14_0_10_36_30]PIZ97727.1 MAG: hypothetical protein COX79_01070 [Candidatus Levybacteria bacterium CG_4_10_14_0_2_um_filter_36_16]
MKKLVLLASYSIFMPIFLLALIIYSMSLTKVAVANFNDANTEVLGTETASSHLISNNTNRDIIAASGEKGRTTILKEFLNKYNSPLLPYAVHIVSAADFYGIDYRLLPAIALQESTLCKKIPKESYNCWGFGIYGGNVTRFTSYEDAIETISKTLAKEYKAKGLEHPTEIMTKYTPQSNGSWAKNVSYIMDRISPSL